MNLITAMKPSATHKKTSSSPRPRQGDRAKIITLDNASFRYLEKSFSEWLDIQGYSPKSIRYATACVRELLHWLEKRISHIKALDSQHLKDYFDYLQSRPNKVRAGGLANNSLNHHILAMRKFTDYLRQVGRMEAPQVPLKMRVEPVERAWLTEEEVRALFQVTKEPITPPERMKNTLRYLKIQQALQSRDRAMLAVYYGCGLRRNEGIHLTLTDFNFDKALLHIRKGKFGRARYVPVSKTSLTYLQEYIYDYRPVLLQGHTYDQLFIGNGGKPIDSQTLVVRLKKLQHQTGHARLQEKEIGLHTLRHSIATHLLTAGMPLETISRFLGHSSLESTQVYTHITDSPKKQPFKNIPTYETIQLHEDE